VANLLLFSSEFKEQAPFLGKIWSVDIKAQIPIRNLKEMVDQIGKNAKIDELILFFHGAPGQIMIGNKMFGCADLDLRKAFVKKTKIETIRFEGCWVAERPGEMAQFGIIFDAEKVAGFTWEHAMSIMALPVQKGQSEESISERLKNTARWIADKTPAASNLAARAKNGAFTQKIMLEWFQADNVGGGAEPPYETPQGQTTTNYEKLGSISYKRRADADKITLTMKDTEEGSSDPISPFQYVTVTK
jgi:hypothetical protein